MSEREKNIVAILGFSGVVATSLTAALVAARAMINKDDHNDPTGTSGGDAGSAVSTGSDGGVSEFVWDNPEYLTAGVAVACLLVATLIMGRVRSRTSAA